MSINDLIQSSGPMAGLFVLHLGHGIGTLKMVALFSISHALKRIPQFGQRNQISPLTITV